MKLRPDSLPTSRKNGFAIIVTVSILVLLAVIAVGLLTLSTVTVRASTLGNAKAEAQANARLALTLAIGELQKSLGPDQRVSAPAQLVDATAKPGLTGVWESFKLNPEGGNNLDTAKATPQSDEEANGEFVAWLSSDSIGNNQEATPPSSDIGNNRATLLTLPDQDPTGAQIIDVQNRGALAWTTMDESVKARFDLPLIDSTDNESELARLRAPERNGVQLSSVLSGYIPNQTETARMTSFMSGEFAASDLATWHANYHNYTPWSAGLATNTVDGGLKGDLTLAFENDTLPNDLDDRHIYSNQKGNLLTPNDPYFATLADYYSLYKTNAGSNTPLQSTIPSGHKITKVDRTTRTYVPNQVPTDGAILAPVVTRVNVAFSLVGRLAHGNWLKTIPRKTGDSNRKYMVYLIYTPVVTIYNPYSVPLDVSSMQVTFQHLPVAFQFFRNGRAQTARPALLSQFHISSQNTTDWEDKFSASLVAQAGSSGSTTVRLNPGEARVFGVNHAPGTNWGQMTNYLWQNDLNRSKTINLETGPGWNYNSGFLVDWLAPKGATQSSDNKTLGVFGVRATDNIDVAFTPAIPTKNGRAVESFGVEIKARVNGSRRATDIGNFRYKYGDLGRLKEAMEAGTHPGLGDVKYPVRREKPWAFREMWLTNPSLPIEDWGVTPKQFALFTLAARTSEDSLYPTKAGRDTSFVHHALDMDITSAHPAQMPMELSFLPVNGVGANTVGSLEVWSADDPRSFFFSGWSVNTGYTNHTTYPVPASPLVNIADLRHANLASSGHLPLQPYTVGEGTAHPLIPSDKAIRKNGPLGYDMADNSWLANNTLWDSYYFSGIRKGDDLQNFLGSSQSKLTPRNVANFPDNMSIADATTLLESGDGWAASAGFQLQKGSFNVQSTSIDAWIALLSSLNGKDIPGTDPITFQTTDYATSGSPFPRMLSAPGNAIDDPAAADNQTRWTGFRDLEPQEITLLAQTIVELIKERGPFLSMSEFVNRKLGSENEDSSHYGLIEEAIRKSGINAASSTGFSRSVTASDAGDFDYANATVAEGDTEEGAAAFLTQGDVLSAIGSSLTVRGDTFTVRAYGDSRDGNGNVLATAVCEAVVQRIPDYINRTDRFDAISPTTTTELHPVNERFGRRFKVISFRWVPAEQV